MEGIKMLLSLAVFLGFPCFAMVIKTDEGFFVNDRGIINAVKPHDVDPFLRKLSPVQLTRFSQMGNRIKAIRLSNGDYMLRAKGDLLGGGPGLAWFSYVAINVASAAAAATLSWCPPAAAAVAIAGHAVATTAAITLAITPTP